MLHYTLRVRDLIHGTILFTGPEERVINHPFFQRLRQIRQNDVAFFVYPSLNTSRFEHVLGTCRVAGMMAEHITQSPKWSIYARELKHETGIQSPERFVELARLYALLHDVGHLPLSHLFEMAIEEYRRTKSPNVNPQEFAQQWSGETGFIKLHEAFGAMIADRIVHDIRPSVEIRQAFLRLMTEKTIPLSDPLSVIKSLVDSEIDADRIDFVQRDGLLAGGEYGHYDIRRLCDSVFLEKDERGWLIAYSEKALTSMEALLLDRYRTHVWIHFHHRVVAMKILMRFLIEKALERGIITKEHFDPRNVESFSLKDDMWLWSVLRGMKTDDETIRMIRSAVFYREKKNVLNLWKNRPAYHELHEEVETKARVTKIDPRVDFGLPGLYPTDLGNRMGTRALIFYVPFAPISERGKVLLYSETKKQITSKNLLEVSKLVANLEDIWEDEMRYFILLVGKNVAARTRELKRRWVEFTGKWLRP